MSTTPPPDVRLLTAGVNDVFVHFSVLPVTGGYRSLSEGQRVQFEVVQERDCERAANADPAPSISVRRAARHSDGLLAMMIGVTAPSSIEQDPLLGSGHDPPRPVNDIRVHRNRVDAPFHQLLRELRID
jgi:cold shock CspA family protein